VAARRILVHADTPPGASNQAGNFYQTENTQDGILMASQQPRLKEKNLAFYGGGGGI